MPIVHVSYRLKEEDKRLIEMLARHLGVSETDVVKLAIRELAGKKVREQQDLCKLLGEDKGIAEPGAD